MPKFVKEMHLDASVRQIQAGFAQAERVAYSGRQRDMLDCPVSGEYLSLIFKADRLYKAGEFLINIYTGLIIDVWLVEARRPTAKRQSVECSAQRR
jgi:hypothetical protein